MYKSASVLGSEYGLNGAEMNRILLKKGFLMGTPGNYELTELGKKYAIEKDFHRGIGGSEQYNRYWTTRKFDENIKEALAITDDLVNEVREEIRAARIVTPKAAQAQAEAEFLAKQMDKKEAELLAQKSAKEMENLISNCKKGGKIALVIGSVLLCGYSVYQLKAWYKEKSISNEQDEEIIN